MNATHLTQIAELARDVVATDGGELLGVQIGEMADGSGRSFALLDTYQAGLEQQYRISSPAPASGAPWTRIYDRWTVEVRVGEGEWLVLEDLAAEAL